MLRNKFYGGVWLLLLFAIQPLSAGAERADPFKIPHTFRDRLRQLTLEKEEIEKQAAHIRLPSIVVEGLIWGGEHPSAVINGKVLKIGDGIEGATIKDITKKGIILNYKGLELIVYVSGGASKWESKLIDEQMSKPGDPNQQQGR